MDGAPTSDAMSGDPPACCSALPRAAACPCASAVVHATTRHAQLLVGVASGPAVTKLLSPFVTSGGVLPQQSCRAAC